MIEEHRVRDICPIGEALGAKASSGGFLTGVSFNLDDVLQYIEAGADLIGLPAELDGPAILGLRSMAQMASAITVIFI